MGGLRPWYPLALEDAFRSLRPGFHRAPLLGFSKIAPPSTWAARVNSDVGSGMGVGHLWAHASDRPCRGPVAFHLHGFSPSWWFAPRAVLRVCCTPLPILGFAEFRAAWPVPRGSGSGPPHRRMSPSKLFPCQQPSPFRGLLPSCRSPPGGPVGSTSRPCSTSQVRRVRKCCHSLSLVASLGFSSASRGNMVHLFRESPPLARNGRAVGTRPFPRATHPWNSLRSPGASASNLAVLDLCREGGAAAVSGCRSNWRREERSVHFDPDSALFRMRTSTTGWKV
jgi:hypothetical protein